MAITVKSSGGGFSKSKVLTDADLMQTATFGDNISGDLTMSLNINPCGGGYCEENDDGTETVYLIGQDPNSNTMYLSVVLVYKTKPDNQHWVQQLSKITLPSTIEPGYNYRLSSDKNSNVIAISRVGGSRYVHKVTKDTFEITNHYTSGQYFTNVTVIDDVVYITSECSLSTVDIYLRAYAPDGSFIRSYANNVMGLGCLGVQQDSNENLYLSFKGNTSTQVGTAMLSITKDGTIRWKKDVSDINASQFTLLRGVYKDGTALWSILGNRLILTNSDGEIIVNVVEVSNASSYYTNDCIWSKNGNIIYLRHGDGTIVYRLNSNLTLINSIRITKGNGTPVVGFLKNRLIKFINDGTLKCSLAKLYNEYMRR